MPSNSNLTLAISLSGLFFLFFIAPTAVILLWHLPTRLARQNAALKTLAKQEGAWAAQKAVEKEVWASYCGGCQAEHDIKNMAEVVSWKNDFGFETCLGRILEFLSRKFPSRHCQPSDLKHGVYLSTHANRSRYRSQPKR